MLVDNAASRAIGQDEADEEDIKPAASKKPDALAGGLGGGLSNPVSASPAFDLDSMLGGPSQPSQPAQAQPVAAGGLDPLADIFGGGGISQPVAQAQPVGAAASDPLGDIFGSGPSQPVAAAQPQA